MKKPLALLLFLFILRAFPVPSVYAGFELGTFYSFYSYDEINAEIDELHATYPTFVSEKIALGTTHQGRIIYAFKVSDNVGTDEDEPEVLYDAAIHGNEPIGMQAMFYYAWYLLEHYDTDPTAKYILDNRELYFYPLVNPDGYVARQRKNQRPGGGVDLNRNFGPQEYWDYAGGGSSTSPGSSTYRGPSVYSEPEAQAMRDFLQPRHVVAAYNYHTCGELFNLPYGYKSDHSPDEPTFSEWGEDLYELNYYFPGQVMDTVGYSVRGWMTDFMYDGDPLRSNIMAIEPEVGNCNVEGQWTAPQYALPLSQALYSPNLYLSWVAGFMVNVDSYTFNRSTFPQGSSAQLSATFKNVGLLTSEATSATLSSSSEYVTITSATKQIPALSKLQTSTTTDPFEFSISSSAPEHQSIELVLTTNLGEAVMYQRNITIYAGASNVPDQPFYDQAETYGITAGIKRHGSASWIDIDNDGDKDLYTLVDNDDNILYINNGVGFVFSDGTSLYGLEDNGHDARNASWVDIDNDGDLDLYLVKYGSANKLYQNNGPNQPFTDVTTTYNLADGTDHYYDISWIDIDNDGDLDVHLGHYYTIDSLLINNGPGQAFTDATSTYQLGGISTGVTFAAVWGDVDRDGDPDLYTVNYYYGTNKLYINNGPNQAFTDASSIYNANPAQYHFSANWVDIDNDGDLDLYTVNSVNKLYINNGPGLAFTDATSTYNLGLAGGYNGDGYWFDVDSDGDLDLLLTTSSDTYMYLNNGPNQAFTDATSTYQVDLDFIKGYRTASPTDFDGDSDIDNYINNNAGNNAFLINKGNTNKYLKIKTNNSNGVLSIGTLVDIDLDGNGDFSASGRILTFNQSLVSGYPDDFIIGLGDNADCTTDVRVYLPYVDPSGTPSYTFNNVCPNQTITFPDNTSSSFTSPTVSNIENTSARISWVTNEQTTTKIIYSSNDNYDQSSAESDIETKLLTHSVELTNLKNCEEYNYKIVAIDNAGNATTSASYNFETPGCPAELNLSPNGATDPDSGNAVLGEKTITNSDEVSVNWDRSDDTSNIDEYVLHYREKGGSWKTETAGPEADSISWDPGEGVYEWYLEIKYTDGSTSTTNIYKFEVDTTAPENQIISIADEQMISLTDEQYQGMLLPYGSPLIFNFGNTAWDTVIEIWNWDKTIHYTTMVCGSGVCDHGDKLTGPLTLVIYTVDEAGNESERREIKITPFGVSANYVPAMISAPEVQGATTVIPAKPQELAPGIVRGAVNVDTSLNPSAIKNPGIVNGAVDVAPAPTAEPPKKLNIIQRIWNSVFH